MTTAPHSSRPIYPNLRPGANGSRRQSRLRVRCPHCGSYARARSSDLLTPTYTEVRFECSNDACGHVWLAGLEALRTLCPSEVPNPAIDIPLAVSASGKPSTEPAAQAAAAG